VTIIISSGSNDLRLIVYEKMSYFYSSINCIWARVAVAAHVQGVRELLDRFVNRVAAQFRADGRTGDAYSLRSVGQWR
jgi:hypothetical protein